MMLATWNLGSIAKTLNERARAAAESMPEPALPCTNAVLTPKRRRLLEPAPKQPSSKEHAEMLLDWISKNVDLTDGPITHAAILEFYTEMLIELDWAPRSWNPVAHQFRVLTTGSRKTYAWITTTTGAVHRLRVYPIPRRAVGATVNRQNSVQLRSAA